MNKKLNRKVGVGLLSAMMIFSTITPATVSVHANEEATERVLTDSEGYTYIAPIASVSKNGNEIDLTTTANEKIRFTFLNADVFRLYMAPEGEEFKNDPDPNSGDHTATIRAKEDDTYEQEYNIDPILEETAEMITISTADVVITIDKLESLIKVTKPNGEIVWEESAPLKYKSGSTVQTLKTDAEEYFYGGGTQNGRFSHKGEVIQIVNTNNWVDKGVASPNPFYWSTDGYGVVRHTWKPGEYDFGSETDGVVTTTHNEKRFDAYYFVGDGAEEILEGYYEFTGKPVELPEYASYLGHLNCYNRDYWLEVDEGTWGAVQLGTKWYKESQSDNGGEKETLLGDAESTAQQIIEDHKEYDMPFGWFLPNDGYGCGYGQSTSLDGDIENLADFANYALDNGIQTGLWTQSNLWPANPANPQKGERDIYKEVEAGVTSVKTDVAWVGPGYSFALNGVSVAYDAIATKSGMKPNIVTLDGWAGTQRYGGIWSGDQSGGQWEYIRFHIPTYIGTGLSGQPNIGSDMDGIFGGQNEEIWIRDFQWKAFTTYMLDMDGWGSNQKSPWALDGAMEGADINRAYLKLKAELMPYINTISHEATAEGGLPMLRAMFLEEENAYTLGTATQYQYMWGDNFLVAPIYQNTAMDAEGNDIRNDIYLPSTSDVWIDYFTGEQYRGGQILNSFDAPIWKLPLFVKNGAIIPMYPENNNPEAITATNTDGLDRSQRIVEFYPHGSTQFDTYEDDGKTLGGASTTTLITSVVDGDNATLSAAKAIGTYTGMVKERSNEFIVNVSKEPTGVSGTVKGEAVTFTKVETQEEYDAAEGNVYFYNPTPAIFVQDYASADSSYATTTETTAPKLYVKSTEKIDITAYDYTVVIAGFENTQDLGEDVLNESLTVPTGLVASDKSDDYITVNWDAVSDAVSYDIEVDGSVYRNVKQTTYTQSGIEFLTDHTYRVRMVADNGNYSNWSEMITVQTDDNPFRNVPENITVDWPYGDTWGSVDNAFDYDQNTMFHSTGAVSEDQRMTLDLGAAYQLDKIAIQPRMDNKGNGAVTRANIYVSLDGINYTLAWDGAAEDAWTYNTSDMDVLDIKEVDLSGYKARYIQIGVVQSSGGFFSASEITTYKKDGTDAWVVGDVNNSGSVDDNDLTFYENYVGLIPSDNDWEYSALGNIDNNDIIDAFDVSYIARLLGTPVTSAAEGVEGKVQMIPSKTDIKAGDTVTIDYYGIGLKNVNAFSIEMPVDTDRYEITNFGLSSQASMFMRNFSKTRLHNNGAVDNYLVFTNIGEQPLINGTTKLGSVTIKATKDFVWDVQASRATLVGQDMSTTDAIIDVTDVPTAPETENILSQNDIETITFSNDVKENIPGEDLWQQANWEDLLFDGDKGALAEFKWYFAGTDIAAEVKVPTTMTFEFAQAQPNIKTIKVYNRAAGNGSITSISAKGYKGDVEYDLGTFTSSQEIFEFSVPAEATEGLDSVAITPLTTNGEVTGTATGDETNRMLSIHEIEFIVDDAVVATGIEFDADNTYVGYVGDIVQVKANVLPSNASIPFYEITSSDESIAKVIKVPTPTAYVYTVQCLTPGEVTLTATSEDGSFSTQTNFVVEGGLNTTQLLENIASFEALHENLYTADSYAAVATLIEAIQSELAANTATQETINTATVDIAQAMSELVFKGSDDSKETSTHLIPQSGLLRYDESSMSASEKEDASFAIDGDINTVWHSNYYSDYVLPQYVTIDLGGVYDLEQVDMLPRQNSTNGHITHYRVEVSSDEGTDKVFTPIVEGYFEHDGASLTSPNVAKEVKFDAVEARYVRFIAIESLGGTGNLYASIAELNFYGQKQELPDDEFMMEVDAIFNATDAATTYTQATWDAFVAARSAYMSATDADKEAAKATLSTAMDALVVRASEALITQLSDTITQYEALETNHTEEEFAAMKASLEAAQIIVDKGYAVASQEEVNNAIIDLADQYQALSDDVSALMDTLKEFIADANQTLADAKAAGNIRPAQLTNLENTIASAQALVDVQSADTNAIREAVSAITTATQQLYEIVDKTDLQSTIDAYSNLQGVYTPESLAVFTTAMDAAKAVVANDDATEVQVNDAKTALVDAYNNLVVGVDKTALSTTIDTVKAMNLDFMTTETAQNVKNAIHNAELVLANTNATQEQVDAALNAINEAKATLVSKPVINDNTEIEVDTQVVQGQVFSARVVNGELTDLVGVYVNNQLLTSGVDYDAVSGSIVINLTPTFTAGLAVGEMTIQVVTTNNVYVATAAVVAAETTQPEQPTTPETPTAPGTGDSTNVAAYLFLILMSGLALVLRKKYVAKK